MKKKYKYVLIALIGVIAAEILFLSAIYLQGSNFAILNPKGIVALQQRDLMIFATVLSLVVVLPVFVLTFFIAWKYRASNTRAKYTPDWDSNKKIEGIWWGVPIILIGILAIVTWNSSYALDPRRPLESSKKPVTVQVVALQWKWLFIYPDHNVASLNYLQFPEDTPINFEITADAPMNSFWIPQLGGQIYAMNGMRTQLNLMASETGDYKGLSANMSGEGFADMKFIARASTQADFDNWIKSLKNSSETLNQTSYAALAQPSKGIQPTSYVSEPNLFDEIVTKYTKPNEVISPTNKDQPVTQTQGMQHGMSHN